MLAFRNVFRVAVATPEDRRWIMSLISSQGRMYVVDVMDGIYQMDAPLPHEELQPPKLIVTCPKDILCSPLYLAECDSEILVVGHNDFSRRKLLVYRLADLECFLQTPEDFYQFITLWSMITQVQLNNEPDKVIWRLTADGRYTTKSAYRAQFLGSRADYEWNRVWKSKVEPKCRFFLWVLLQNKLWTADRITRHGGQTNPICQLCKTQSETAYHLMADCSYSRLVWQQLAAWIGDANAQLQPSSNRQAKVWWTQIMHVGVPGRLELVEGKAQKTLRQQCKNGRPTTIYHQI
jgi:hypothetical protein